MVAVFTVCLVGYFALVGFDFVSGLINVWRNAGRVELVYDLEVEEEIDLFEFDSLFPAKKEVKPVYAHATIPCAVLVVKEEVEPVSYDDLNRPALRNLCKERGIKNYVTLSNNAVMELLKQYDRQLAA